MQHSTGYIIGFAAVVCLVASLFVAGSAVGLKDLQDANKRLDVQKKVLTVAGLMDADAGLSAEEIDALIDEALSGIDAEGMAAMGPLMGKLKPQLQGRADMGEVSQRVKAKLGA